MKLLDLITPQELIEQMESKPNDKIIRTSFEELRPYSELLEKRNWEGGLMEFCIYMAALGCINEILKRKELN